MTDAMEALEAAMGTAKLVPLGELYPAPWNPREITEERLLDLRRSMDADPAHLWARPLLKREDGMVIAGNHRLLAAGLNPDSEPAWPLPAYDALPAWDAYGLTDDEAQVIALRDNENYAVWKVAEVADLLAGLASRGVDLGLTGFSREGVTKLLDGFQAAAPADAPHPDDAPDPPVVPRSKLGEVYELGAHRLICGDCRDPEVMAELMDGVKANVLWTDPPYGVSYVGKAWDEMTIQHDDMAGLPELLDASFKAADEWMTPLARFYIASPTGPNQMEFRRAINDVGWRFHQGLVWVKDVMVLGHMDYHAAHEDIFYGWKVGKGRAGRGNHPATRWYGDHSQTTVFNVARPRRNVQHPTMKPTELVVQMLKNSSRRGDVVLDLFGGSGTTLIACEMLGRKCRMAEIDPVYCDVIRDRYEAFVAAPEPEAAAV